MRIKFKEKNSASMSRHGYHELNHFCLRYDEKKARLREIEDGGGQTRKDARNDSTANKALALAMLREDIELIESTVRAIDEREYKPLLVSITKGLPYEKIIANGISVFCGRRQFYDKRKKLFELLYFRRNCMPYDLNLKWNV